MYHKHPGCTPVELYGGITAWVPPVGKVYDHFTEKMVDTGVYERSPNKKDQYWKSFPLPEWYIKKRKQEEKIILDTQNPEFVIEECEEYRRQEWFRRMNGFWFYNNGEPTYITGLHYLYLNWWPLDNGLPMYLGFDRPRFYHIKYCIDDPKCFGRVEVGPRRSGKTYIGGITVYEPVSRSSQSNGGLQSKTDADAKQVFGKALVSQFRKLPHFFRPVYDKAGGTIPKSEIRFFNTSKKGKQASIENMEEELESIINYKSSGTYAYDGQKLKAYLGDEIFKTEECDVYDRHKVVKECLVDNMTGKIIGKANYTSTVEEIEGQLETYQKFWDDSDFNQKNKNGQTTTGLYRYFINAAEAQNIDKYGGADIEKNTKIILNTIEGMKNQKDISDYKRKYPLSIKDAFRPQSKDCHYDLQKLEDRYDILSVSEPKYVIGDFRWININDITEGVKFVPVKNGKFKLHKDIDYNSGEWNNVEMSGSLPIPRK
jgi:hypothetical protein